jgi:hypothetical protein
MFLLLSILLTAIGVAVFPCWRHSARWGYAPSAVVGVLLVAVAVLAAGGVSSFAELAGNPAAQQQLRVVEKTTIGIAPVIYDQ